MTPIPARATAVAALLALAGCATPPREPAAPPSPPLSAARQVMDAQYAARPMGPPAGLNGDEATVIYQNYLKQIGRPETGGNRPGNSGRGSSSGASAP
jgi:hypothetical protein